MPIYYKKAPPKKKVIDLKEYHTPQPIVNKDQLTVRNLIVKIRNSFTANHLSHFFSLIIPLIFIICGLSILSAQLRPYITHYINSHFSNDLNQDIISLIPERYNDIQEQYITDPGAAYFSKILGTEEKKETSQSYNGKFYLTIEKIKINKAPVTANVDSYNEASYLNALKDGLAHFKGTRLPGENGNVFIYGHSAAGNYAERHPEDIITAFTRLTKLTIGDEIKIFFQNNEYSYSVRKIKEVNPDDIDMVNTESNQKVLTLMTCSPPGLNSKRLLVIAYQK